MKNVQDRKGCDKIHIGNKFPIVFNSSDIMKNTNPGEQSAQSK